MLFKKYTCARGTTSMRVHMCSEYTRLDTKLTKFEGRASGGRRGGNTGKLPQGQIFSAGQGLPHPPPKGTCVARGEAGTHTWGLNQG